MKEFEIIKKYFAPLSSKEKGAFNLSDDGAVIPLNNASQLALTTDCLISGIHFLKTDPPDLIAWKALAVNVSDLAAMGAGPKSFLLSIAWPQDIKEEWISLFAHGLDLAQTEFGTSLIGGDTVSTHGPMTISIAAVGEVFNNNILKRNGASVGDDLYVTGTIGDAYLGLQVVRQNIEVLNDKDRGYLKRRYQKPDPKHNIGLALSDVASAAIDVSDGFLQDLNKVLTESGVSVTISLENIPFSLQAKNCLEKNVATKNQLLTGGDDYELIFTAPKKYRQSISSLGKANSIPLTRIGCIEDNTNKSSINLFDKNNQHVELPKIFGFQHF